MAQYAVIEGEGGSADYAEELAETYGAQLLDPEGLTDPEWRDTVQRCTGVMVLGDVDEKVQDYLRAQNEDTSLLTDQGYDGFLQFDYDDMVLDGLWAEFKRAPRRQQATTLGDTIADHETWAVGIHNNPDPDAISSAVAFQYIAEHQNVDADIFYAGAINHQENTALKNVLDLELNQDTIDPDAYDGIAMLDTASPDNIAVLDDIDLDAVDILIDHHATWSEYDGEAHAVFDVRPDRSATAGIMSDHLQGLAIDPNETVSTALVHGIYADTDRLTPGRTGSADMDALSFLYRHADESSLDDILASQRSLETLRLMGEAAVGFEPQGTAAVSYLGDVDDTDAMAQAADLLNTYEQGKTAVVTGIVDSEFLEIKVRSSDATIHAGDALADTITEMLDDASDENVSFGGHQYMAGASVPLDLFDVPLDLYESDESDDQDLFQDVMSRVIKRRYRDFGRDA